MLENLIFTKKMGLMDRALDAATLRNSAISNNLANVDTPGYKRFDVIFEEKLKNSAENSGGLKGRKTDVRHMDIGSKNIQEITPSLVREEHTGFRNDGNNVDIDKEMAALAKNTLMYNFLADEVRGEFQKIKKAIVGKG